MENELIKQKGWWQRNGIWVISITIIIVAVGIYLINNDSVGQFGRAYTDIPLYENAVEQAQNNKDVADALGTIQPIDKITIAEGNVNYIGDSVSSTITIKGTKAKAKLDIAALKENGQWVCKLIKVRIKEPKQEIIVLAE